MECEVIFTVGQIGFWKTYYLGPNADFRIYGFSAMVVFGLVRAFLYKSIDSRKLC